jgi:hypothetical protein
MDDVFFFEKLDINSPDSENSPGRENSPDSEQVSIGLFNASRYLDNPDSEEGAYFSWQSFPRSSIDKRLEAGFVYLHKGSLSNANGSSVARRFIFQNTQHRRHLISKTIKEVPSFSLSDAVFSYHVNVGHGNCSIIYDAGKNFALLIDCSKYDFRNKKYYYSNVDQCLSYIKKKHGIATMKIDVMVQTHPHYDHYSGFEELIKQGFVNPSTVVYINQYYSMPSPIYNKILSQINSLGCRIVEPVVNNSGPGLRIVHPSSRVVKTKNTIYNDLNPIIEPNPNNASIVFSISNNNKSFMFTGDIETDGWNRITGCMPYLRYSDFLALAHHGSQNGHLRTKCPVNRSITSVANCIKPRAQTLIMGRSGAYSGLPSNVVVQSFPSAIYSEMDQSGNHSRFVEIDWSTGCAVWI